MSGRSGIGRVGRGLELFAAGDYPGAARLWVRAKADQPDDVQIEAYLAHLRQLVPDVVADACEKVRADGSGLAPESDAAPGKIEIAKTAPVSPVTTEQDPAPAKPPRGDAPVASTGGPKIPVVPPSVPIPMPPAEPAPPIRAAQTVSAAPPAVRPVGGADPWGADAQLGPAIEVEGGSGGLGMVVASVAPVEAPFEFTVSELVRDEARLKLLLDLDDFTGALDVAERLLQADPEHILALEAQKLCHETLDQMCRSKIGDVDVVPSVLVSPEEIIWLDLDHRSGFLLAQVDGASSFDEIIELSGMDVHESLRIMAGLVQKGVIGTR
ncbi:MAG: hypothetical protein V3T05_03170 [Myxococcota bacterium]